MTSARAAGLARQLGLTPRYVVRGVRALDALGTRVAQLAGDTRLARDVAAQQLVVYLPATAAKKRVIMAAGHCVEDVNTVRNEDLGQAFLGWRIAGAYFTGFRSSDVGLIELSALADSYTNINTHVGTKVVQGRHSPVTGMTICKSGATTGWTYGDVVVHFTNYQITYGCCTPVKDLWSMTACVRPGDSGGPIMSGDYAIGLTSGMGPLHRVTACAIDSGRSSETSGDYDHTARFVSIDHLRASYPGLEIRHS